MKILFICFIILILCPIPAFSQLKNANRYPNQSYIEDSIHVCFTCYPNPFSPPTITDSIKGLFCGTNTFYCDISDTVLVTYQNIADSVVYCKKVISKSPPEFSYCTWVAGPFTNPDKLPKFYYHDKGAYKIVLKVNGRKKCYVKISILDNRYYWIDSN